MNEEKTKDIIGRGSKIKSIIFAEFSKKGGGKIILAATSSSRSDYVTLFVCMLARRLIWKSKDLLSMCKIKCMRQLFEV